MIEIKNKSKCSGCSACMTICPKKAITMIEDNKRFKYPIIDKEICINCGLCETICPILNTISNNSINLCYVAYNKDSRERMNGSSGSVFSLIANYILDNGGIVIGAALDNNNQLKHIAINNKKELESLRKSKYIQSDLDNIFAYVKEQLKIKKVLFVGTPCQVAGLKSFIKQNDNLITIDLFCHGVPSPKLFEKYIRELENKYNDKLVNYDFRDNSTGWDSYSNKMTFKNNTIIERHEENIYMKLFLSNIPLRESCYNCNFKLGNKYSDITLGDFWGVKKYYPEMYNKEGVSAIVINTTIGITIFESIKRNLEYKNCTIDEILDGNPSLRDSCARPKNIEDFFNDLDNLSIDELTKKYITKNNIYSRLMTKIKKKLTSNK